MAKHKRPSFILISIACISISLVNLLPGLASVPIISYIAETYNSISFAKLFFIIPSLVILPFLLASKLLSKIFSNKQLIVSGMLIYVISGFALMLLTYIPWVLFFRSLIGVASGLVIPFSTALINQFFYGRDRDRILAISGLTTYLFGVVMFVALGYLVDVYWKLGFLVFFIALIPMFLIYYFIPNTKKNYYAIPVSAFMPTTISKEDILHNKAGKNGFGVAVWLSLIYSMLMIIIGFSYFTDLGILIKQKNIGNDIQSNIVFSIIMLSGLASNVIIMFYKQFNLYKLRMAQLFCVSFSLLMVTLPFVSIKWIYVSAVLFGLGYGSISTSTSIIIVNYIIPNNKKVNAILVFTFLTYLSQVLSPFITDNMYESMGIYSINNKFLTSGMLLFTVLTVLIIRYWYKIYNKQRLKDHKKAN